MCRSRTLAWSRHRRAYRVKQATLETIRRPDPHCACIIGFRQPDVYPIQREGVIDSLAPFDHHNGVLDVDIQVIPLAE